MCKHENFKLLEKIEQGNEGEIKSKMENGNYVLKLDGSMTQGHLEKLGIFPCSPNQLLRNEDEWPSFEFF